MCLNQKTTALRVPITELPNAYVGGAKIKTDGPKQQTSSDVITH